MADYKFVELDYTNRKLTDATVTEHRAVIEDAAKQGWRFVASIPTRIAGSGKIMQADLVFEK
jgi:hypothetical protein